MSNPGPGNDVYNCAIYGARKLARDAEVFSDAGSERSDLSFKDLSGLYNRVMAERGEPPVEFWPLQRFSKFPVSQPSVGVRARNSV